MWGNFQGAVKLQFLCREVYNRSLFSCHCLVICVMNKYLNTDNGIEKRFLSTVFMQ